MSGGVVTTRSARTNHLMAVLRYMGKAQTRHDSCRYTPAVQTSPVFADPSGRRRRVMRRIGFTSAAALAICLAAVVVAIAGGPTAPFTEWAAPQAPAAASHGNGPALRRSPDHGGASLSPLGSQSEPTPSPAPSASQSVSPTARSSASGSPTTSSSSGSPVPTNPAGRTPPGRTKSPRPGNGSHGA